MQQTVSGCGVDMEEVHDEVVGIEFVGGMRRGDADHDRSASPAGFDPSWGILEHHGRRGVATERVDAQSIPVRVWLAGVDLVSADQDGWDR